MSWKIIPLDVQARRWGVTVEQMRAQALRCAKATLEMEQAALRAEAKGKRHTSGKTSAELREYAFALFAQANS